MGYATLCNCGHAAMLHRDTGQCRVNHCRCKQFTTNATMRDMLSSGSLAVLMAVKASLVQKQPILNRYGARYHVRAVSERDHAATT